MREPPERPPLLSLARAIRFLPLAVALGYVLLAGFKMQPEVRFLPGMPLAVGRWLDEHDFAKNFFGFGLLTLAMHLALPGKLWRNATVVAALVAAIELVQLFMPHRFADWKDILMGWSAVFCVTAAAATLRRERRRENS